MSSISKTIAGLEPAQIGWVVPDIHAAVKFLAGALGIAGFPEPEHIRAQDMNMTQQAAHNILRFVCRSADSVRSPAKRWVLPPRSWASRPKDGPSSNK